MGIWTSSWLPCPRLPQGRLSVLLRNSQTKNEKEGKREEKSPYSSMNKKENSQTRNADRPSRPLSGQSLGWGWGCHREAELLLPRSTSLAIPADIFQDRLLCGGTTIKSRSQLRLSCTSQEFGSSGDKALYILLLILSPLQFVSYRLWTLGEFAKTSEHLIPGEDAGGESIPGLTWPWSQCSPTQIALESAWGCSLQDPHLQKYGATNTDYRAEHVSPEVCLTLPAQGLKQTQECRWDSRAPCSALSPQVLLT